MIAKWVLPVLIVQVVVLLLNVWHWRRRQVVVATGDMPLQLSVLIPVRNERERLPQLVGMLRNLQPAPLEVILCDDSSDDGSREWLQQNLPLYGEGDQISWFPAPAKPEGWIGKNWACYQLAQRAKGDWLMFIDADVRLAEHSIGSMADGIRRFAVDSSANISLVTAVPSLEASSLLVGLLKSIVPFSVFTLLPLPLSERHPHPAFAFANGQLIAFAREYYRRMQPHERVRNAVLEDVQLARLVKQDGSEVRILDARKILRVSMYRRLGEAVDGFSKNGVAVCGTWWSASIVGLALALVYLVPVAEMVWLGVTGWHVAHYALSAGLFGISGWMAGLPWWYGMLFPLSLSIGEMVLWRSIGWYLRGEVRWKGRTYRVC